MNQWTIVRIFISSTFKDMDVERDALRNIVVPRLNDFFVGQRVNVQLVDLRHSVETDSQLTHEEREKRVYNICMDEIDACQPFFLGLVGHRYGWIPKDFEITNNYLIPDDFPLRSNQLSVTVCEFLHALYGKNASNRTLVLLRDDKSYSNLSEKERKEYIDQDEKELYIRTFRDFLLNHKQELSVEEPYLLNLKDSEGKEIEKWSNQVYKKLLPLILQHIGNQDSLDEDNFLKAQREHINRHLVIFKGREKVIDECIKNLERRQALYIYEKEHGMGQTALLCKLYAILSEDPQYLCLFNSYEACIEASHYHNVFYYWNLQMLRFLGRDDDNLKNIKGNAKLLFEEYCRLCQAVFEEKHVKVIVFEENPHMMGEHYSIKQAFNLYVQTIPAGHDSCIEILAPYILDGLTDEDFNALTQGLRKGILHDLKAKKHSMNVKWLSLATNILNCLNKLDYQIIRSKDSYGDNERNINYYLYQIISEMPDSYEDLSYFWIKRLENVLGKDFVTTYIGVLGISRGLTEADIAQLTGRNIDWCIYFKHILGKSIFKEDNDGYLTLQEDIIRKVVENWSKDYRKELCQKLNSYIQQLPNTSPTYQRNIFTVAMECDEYKTCLAFISQKDNYHYFWGESYAMLTFDQKAKNHPDEYFDMVSEMVRMAPLDYDAFHGLNLWCNLAAKNHDYLLYLKTAQLMIDRLEEAESNGQLNSSTELALAEIYDLCGGSYVELPDGEESWDISNQKQLKLCFKHFNESLEWNARLMEAIYDRYEGFRDIRERWQYLNDTFIPLEAKGVLFDSSPQFDYYFRLLREVAILMVRFEKDSDPKLYAMKAYEVAKSLKDRQIQASDIAVNSDSLILEWIFSAWQVYRLSPSMRSMSQDNIDMFVESIIEEMKEHVDKIFFLKSYSVVFAQLLAEYAMRKCHSDAQKAMGIIDNLLDSIIINDTPDDTLDFQMSQKDILFMTRTVSLMELGTDVRYSDISLAWALVARCYIRMVAQDDVDSQYTKMGDETENVMKFINAHPSNIWDRQLDSDFVLLSALYVKLYGENQNGFPNKLLARNLIEEYLELFKKTAVHYRYVNFIQFERVRQCQEALIEEVNNRIEFTQEELEHLIDDGAYNTIIQTLCYMENGSKEEFYYLGLAFLRNNQFDNAIKIYQTLLDIENLPGGFYFSCITNYLCTLLAAGHRKAFYKIYQQLGEQEQQDTDIDSLYRAYLDSLNRYDGRLTLPQPYGYKL